MWKNFTGKTLFSPCNDPVRDCRAGVKSHELLQNEPEFEAKSKAGIFSIPVLKDFETISKLVDGRL